VLQRTATPLQLRTHFARCHMALRVECQPHISLVIIVLRLVVCIINIERFLHTFDQYDVLRRKFVARSVHGHASSRGMLGNSSVFRSYECEGLLLYTVQQSIDCQRMARYEVSCFHSDRKRGVARLIRCDTRSHFLAGRDQIRLPEVRSGEPVSLSLHSVFLESQCGVHFLSSRIVVVNQKMYFVRRCDTVVHKRSKKNRRTNVLAAM
jgi:hypothetical protein